MSAPSALAQVQSRSGGAHASAGVLTIRSTVRIAGLVAAGLTSAVCVIALAVGLTYAAAARHWLAYPFSGIPARPAVAAMIFVHNLRALVAIGGLLLVAQSPHWASNPAPGPIHLILQRVGEALLVAAVAANVILVGASLGAYGLRMVRAALPHGLVELAVYSLAVALYLQGRHRPLAPRRIATIVALSIALLAVAAVLETFVNV